MRCTWSKVLIVCVEKLIDTSHLRRSGYWSGIWRLKVPPKINNLIWRMYRGACLLELDFKIKECNVNCLVLLVTTRPKTSPMYFLLILLLRRSGIEVAFGTRCIMRVNNISHFLAFVRYSARQFSTLCCSSLASMEASKSETLARCIGNCCSSN